MKVTPQEELSWHKDKLKKLAKHRKREVDLQQKETKLIRDDYRKQKAEVQLQGEEDIHNAVKNSQKEINKSMAGKKEKLERFRTSNIKHRQTLEDQRMDLDKYNDLRSTDMNRQFEVKYNDIFKDGTEKVQELEKEIARRHTNINDNQELDLKIYRADMNAQLMDAAQDFGSRVKDKTDVHKEVLRRNDITHASSVGRQRLEHQDNTSKLLLGQRHETTTRKILHQEKLKTTEDHQNEQIKSKKKAFEEKTQAMEKDHLSVLTLIKERFAKRLNDVKEGFSKKKAMVESKNSDPFYNVGKIAPTLKEFPDSYIVSMKVPEHEKENITISPRNRYIKITYHRKHSDRVEEVDGTTNTSKRTELMTKQIPTTDILNPSGVTQKYEDGILNFKIKKA